MADGVFFLRGQLGKGFAPFLEVEEGVIAKAVLTSLLIETPHPDGPFGAKGVGEAAIGPVAPAIGNAVANALNGARVRDLPMRPDRVLTAIEAQEGSR